MTDSELQQILKMIDDGKISAEQGLVLMQALQEEPEDTSQVVEPPGVIITPPFDQNVSQEVQPEHRSDPEFERKLSRFRQLWVFPLWLGTGITVLGAYWMYVALSSAGMGFWFFAAWLPFLLGVLLTALAFSSRSSRWIYIDVRQKPGASPQRIVLAFPLSLVSWGLKLGLNYLPGREGGAASDVMSALQESARSGEPLLVDVEEDGEHVQVYIG